MVTTKARLPRVLTAALVLTAGGTAALAWSERTTIHSSAGNSFTAATVVLTDEDLKSLPVERSREIEVVEFVPTEQIDPVRFDRSYFSSRTRTRRRRTHSCSRR